MITEEKINQVSLKMLDNKEITTKDLKEIGFTQQDLTNLVKAKRLIRVKIGYYSVPADELYKYGKQLVKKREIDIAYKIFKVCDKLEPNNMKTLLQLFYHSVRLQDFEHAFEYFDSIFESEKNTLNDKADHYLYLYLLSHVTDIPKKYKFFVQNIQVEEIELKKKTAMYPDLTKVNKMRSEILENKFGYVIFLLNQMSDERKFSSIMEVILKELLVQAHVVKLNNLNILNTYIENHDYSSVISMLEKEKEMHRLSSLFESLLCLARDYIKIENTKNIPDKQNVYTKNATNAIRYKDYSRALELWSDSIGHKSETVTQFMYNALNDINKLIADIKSYNESQSVLPQQKEITFTFAEVAVALIGKKREEAEEVLNQYFKQKDIMRYKGIIDNLLDIGVLENDLCYSKAMLEIANVSQLNYSLDISDFVQGFYLALNTEQYAVANHYLNILEFSNELIPNKINVDVLRMALEKKQCEEKVQALDVTEEHTEDDKVEEIGDDEHLISSEINDISKSDSKPVLKEIVDEDEKFIRGEIELFKRGLDIIILNPMPKAKRGKIHGIIDGIEHVKSFSIGRGESKRVVLVNSPQVDEVDRKRELGIAGDRAYSRRDYKKCIECYRKLLYTAKPTSNIYIKLGLSYLHIGQNDKAIEYLEVASELNKKEGKKFDYSNLINQIIQNNEELKPKVFMQDTEFTTDDDTYGITDMDEISRMVFADGLSLKEACSHFNYDENQMNIIRLIYAEEYYRALDYQSGDALLQEVKECKNKSNSVISILQNVESRKIFYKNRPKEKDKSYVYMYK